MSVGPGQHHFLSVLTFLSQKIQLSAHLLKFFYQVQFFLQGSSPLSSFHCHGWYFYSPFCYKNHTKIGRVNTCMMKDDQNCYFAIFFKFLYILYSRKVVSPWYFLFLCVPSSDFNKWTLSTGRMVNVYVGFIGIPSFILKGCFQVVKLYITKNQNWVWGFQSLNNYRKKLKIK